ncbi:hypothetical protein, partial [Escherichia coli]|uniref:hypothetical protein n=1 Tax=Escherichia coli TaxID=562 RepID=UPI001BDB7E65
VDHFSSVVDIMQCFLVFMHPSFVAAMPDFWMHTCCFTFVSIINAPGLVNGDKPFYYRRQRTYSPCRYVPELNNKFCADYSM